MLKCSKCYGLSRDDSRFCTSCGTEFLAPTAFKSKKNSTTIVVVVLGVLFSCGICGIIGKLGDNPKNAASPETASIKNTSVLTQEPVPSATTTPETNGTPRTLVSKSPDKSKIALVISDAADMLDAPKSDAAVMQRLREGTKIEVVRQNGAWFYVSTDGQKGWIHGNSIRYESSGSDLKTEKTVSPVKAPKTTYSDSPKIAQRMPEPKINNSGATAKCRDGSLSYSAHRRGTCSHHGGVAIWY